MQNRLHPGILTVTLNPTVDISSDVETVEPTRKLRTSNELFDPGGGGLNVARVIHVLGGRADALYLAGGVTGRVLDELLEQSGITRHSVSISGATRLAYTVHERSTGREFRFVPEGPEVLPEEVARCLAQLTRFSGPYIVASGSIPRGTPHDTYARMADIAAASGARFVLDTSGPALGAALERGGIFLVKPSGDELEQWAGRHLDRQGQRDAAQALVAAGRARYVAVTLGGDGALLAGPEGLVERRAPEVRARSAVGAGDSFLGAMVWALATGHPPAEALDYGMAAGAATVLTPGTQLCRRADILAILERIRAPAATA